MLTTHKRHQKFDYTAIVDRMGTVGRSNYNYPTVVINRYTAQTSHSPHTQCNQKDTRLKMCK